MSWRTVVIRSRAKLDYKMHYMIVRKDFGLSKIYIDEIYMLLIESTAVSMTAVLLNELIKAKVKIVFCDEKRNPSGELIPFYGSHNTSKRCREQTEWSKEIQSLVWTELIRKKIHNQMKQLSVVGKEECKMLQGYLSELTLNDETSREGHAAKVYFNALFGQQFSRQQDIPINAALNYGYAILLSAINREIVSHGYITQLGLWHSNQFNPFNLGSDFIEPIRGIIDAWVINNPMDEFTKVEKLNIIDLLSTDVLIDGAKRILSDAIPMYCRSVFNALNRRALEEIRFIEYEL